MTGRWTSGGMPDLVSPMSVSAGSGQPPTGADWVVELAWTGHRCIAYVEPGRRTRLFSANDVSMTAAYPELAAPLEQRSPPRGMVVDGTIVARGEEHAPRARLLKRRSARFRPSEQLIRETPVDYQVADLLWLDGHSTVDLPYRDRRALLEGLGFDSAPVWTTAPLPVSELSTMLQIADAKGVDALHARHLGSRYRAGGRSPLWLKVPVPRTRHVVVGGWTPTDPRRPDTIAALLLGVPDGAGGLRYVGRVGVAGDERRHVAPLRRLRRSAPPFDSAVPGDVARHAVWLQPRLVGSVDFTGWVSGGRLRLPMWRGLVDPARVDLSDPAGPLVVGGTRWATPPEPPPLHADATAAPAEAGDRTRAEGRSRAGLEQADPEPSGPELLDPEPSGSEPPGSEPPGSEPPGSEPPGSEPSGPVPLEHAPEPAAATTPPATGPAGSTPPGSTPPGSSPPATAPPTAPASAAVERRRLEQHFVYNALNTIAALIRTDPSRARDLLFGFADLSRAADRSGDAASTLGNEMDAVRGYLQLEQARFGKRLRVELDVDAAVHGFRIEPLRLLAAVREIVQRDIEPRSSGGVLTLTARPVAVGCRVTVVGGSGDPTVIELPGAVQGAPSDMAGGRPG